QSWSKYTLEPYGVDSEGQNISNAHELFTKEAANFLPASFEALIREYPTNFPRHFDFIYWGVWVNFNITKDIIDWLLDHLNKNGRLILGFYPDRSTDPSDVKDNIGKLRTLGFKLIEMKNSVVERHEKLVIIENN
ncbi:MAG TPA: hypothetical protein VHA74_00335, partial [Candidatus Dojkabacteria bacterium]|nr:hypothetical protein [Candidatus Dojkabacteria bacterium]